MTGLPVPAAERNQLGAVLGLLANVLGDDLIGAWLYGSAVAGGLRPDSDLDVLALANRPLSGAERRAVIDGLLRLSGRRATAGPARSIELTVLVESEVRPWRYPPRLELQYGDWWRPEFERGELAPWADPNPDVAVLVTTARGAAVPLVGPAADVALEPVPRRDLVDAMLDGIPALLADLDADTRNVILTFARIWTTLETGAIRPKDAAADWALERLPDEHRPVLARARSIYLGEEPERWDDLGDAVAPHVRAVLRHIRAAAGAMGQDGAMRARSTGDEAGDR